MSTTNTTTKIARSPLLAIFIALVFLAGPLPGPGELVERAAAQNSGLRVTGPDYATEVDTIYGEDSYAYVVLTQAASDTTEQRDLVNATVTTPDDTAGITIGLWETGPETGVFIGGFGFSTTEKNEVESHPFYGRIGILEDASDHDTGRIKVPATEAGTDTVVATIRAGGAQDTVTWRESQTADISILNRAGTDIKASDNTFLGTQTSLSFSITDKDLDESTSVDVLTDIVHVTTDSDPTGKAVTMTESGAQTGVFTGSMNFRTNPTAGSGQENTVFVRHGDQVYATVLDRRDETGERVLNRFPANGFEWTFNMATTGQILFDKPTYVGSTNGQARNGLDRAVLTVIDADPNRNNLLNHIPCTSDPLEPCASPATNTVTVTVNGGSSQTVTLRELPGAAVGTPTTFIAVLGFNCGTGDQAPPAHVHCLGTVPNGATIAATYTDTPSASGAASGKTATAVWRSASTATLTLGPGPNTDRLFGTAAPVSVQLTDSDANRNPSTRDSVTVKLKSTSRPTGMDLTLLETTSNSGVFTGTFHFTTSASESTRLLVADRDLVTVHHEDPVGADAKAALVSANGGKFVVWRADSVATVTTGATQYHVQKASASATDYLTRADVFVTDADQNNPLVRDTLTATAVRLTGDTQTASVQLQETGIDTGVFHGYVGFTTSATPPAGNLTIGSDRMDFTVEYIDVIVPGGDSRSASAPTASAWRSIAQDSDAVLRFEKTREGVPERVDTYYLDASNRTGSDPAFTKIRIVAYAPAGSGTLLAKLESTLCTEGTGTGGANEHREVTLTEDAVNAGRYAGTFELRRTNTCENTDPVTNSNYLAVALDTSFTTRVVLPTSGSALTASTPVKERVLEEARFVDRDGTTDVTRVSGLNRVTALRIEKWDHNLDSTRREVFTQAVVGNGGGGPTSVVMAETGPNTGVFVGSFVFDTAGPDSTLQEVHVQDAKRLKLHGPWFNNITVPEYKMTSGASVTTSTGAKDTVSWWPGSDATVTVPTAAFANRAFTVRLEDGDGLANRKFEEVSVNGNSYTFANGPHVTGSELILVSRTQEKSDTAEQAQYTMRIEAGPSGHAAAEAIGDKNFDGVVDCRDITLTGERRSDIPPPVGATPTPIDSASMTCVSVARVGTTSSFDVTYSFADPFGKRTCEAGTSGGQTFSCVGIVQSWYRARLVSTCHSTDGSAFEYRRDGATMRFCDTPGTGQTITMTYLLSERTINVRSLSATGTLESETVKAVYDTNDDGSANLKWVFRATVPVQTTAGSGDGTIHVSGTQTRVQFVYNDPTRGYDSGPGSADAEHLRAIRATETWRAASTASVKVMKTDFSGEASAPVFGPAIPVEIVDTDADRSPSIDVISATIETPGGGPPTTFTLRESGPTTGIFRGIAVAPSGTPITVRFSDEAGTTGDPTTASKVVAAKTAGMAAVEIGTEGTLNSAQTGLATSVLADAENRPTGTLGRVFVLVNDPDANKQTTAYDQIQVRVRSDSEPDGPLITLTEVAVDSGVFLSSEIRFETQKLAGNDRIFATDPGTGNQDLWDRVWAEYEDQNDGEGNRRVIRPLHGDGYTHWDRQFDGIVRFEQAFSKATATGASCLPVISCAHLTVADMDRNMDPKRVERIAVSQADLKVGQVTDAGEFAAGTPAQVFTQLVETGANTGLFIGFATFKTGTNAPESHTSPTLGKIGASNTATIKAMYNDPDPANGVDVSANFTDTTQWFNNNHGVLAFDKRGYTEEAGTATLRLYDGNAPTAQSVVVDVTSDADQDGIEVSLASLTGRPGVWEGSFTLGTGTNALQVNPSDTLRASYTDASPAGTRISTAVVSIGDELAPVTTLLTTPATPDGENGWFLTAPSITLQADEAVESTRFILDSGAVREYTGPVSITTEGVHTIEFWSVDFGGNEETHQTLEVKYDATAPTVSVQNLTARSAPLGAIQMTWAPAAAKSDPTQFGSYVVFQGTTSNRVGNSTTESFSHTPASDGTHTYLVVVADEAGNYDASKAVSVSGISDRVAPRMAAASVSPPELFAEFDTNLTVTITGTVNEADLSDVDRVETSVLGPVGQGIANVTMTRQGTTNVWRGTFADFSSSGNYTFSVAALDVAGNAAPRDRNVRFHAIDEDPPVVLVPATVVQGTPLAVEVRDNDKGIATVSYRLDGGAQVNVPVSGGPQQHTFSIPTGSLSLGTHALSITVVDLNGTANFATYDETFTVTDSDGGSGTPSGGPPTIALDSKFVENGGSLPLVVGSQGPLTGLTVSFDGGAAQAVLSSWSLSSKRADVNVGSLAAGKHTVVVVATNAVDTTTRSFEVYVLDPGVPLPPTGVTVTRGEDGFPKITWDPSPSANVGGYLVHRSSSPYKVIKVLDAETLEYTDRTAVPGQTYQYAVTAFGTTGQGRVEEGSDSEGALPFLLEIEGSSFTVEGGGSNFWTVFWVILILLVVVTAVVLLVVYRERIFQPRGQAGEIYDDDYPDSGAATLPFGEEQHDLRCPNCTTQFSVTGEKPIVTTCPNCGKKGILR